MADVSLVRAGVVGIQASEITPKALFGIANEFGIPWYLVYDGDKGRNKYERHALQCLGDAQEADRMVCPYPNLEDFLQANGFADVYRKSVNKVKAVKKAVDRMADDAVPVPDGLNAIIAKVVELARA